MTLEQEQLGGDAERKRDEGAAHAHMSNMDAQTAGDQLR